MNRLRLALSLTVAFVLQVLPLPAGLALFRPPFVVLAVAWWAIVMPRLGGIGAGFVVGLALDVVRGAVLGQHALATALVAYVAVRQHLLVRHKPALEQSLFMLGLLVLWQGVVSLIDLWTGQSGEGWRAWVPVVVGAVLWPVAAHVMDRLSPPAR
ncbi:MAG: rod shape-determining protein MreD [Gammaproteobacteria bacterium]